MMSHVWLNIKIIIILIKDIKIWFVFKQESYHVDPRYVIKFVQITSVSKFIPTFSEMPHNTS